MIEGANFWEEAAGIKEDGGGAPPADGNPSDTPPADTPPSGDAPPADAPAAPADAPEATLQEPKELSESEVLAFLKKNNIAVGSLAELKPAKTPEEIELEKEQRKNKMLAFGLETGKVKKDEYDTFQQLQADKLQLVEDEFVALVKDKNPNIDEAELESLVSSYMLSHLDDDDVLKISRQKELLEIADSRLKSKFASIYNLENEYSEHESRVKADRELAQKIESSLPTYTNDVSKALADIKKFEMTVNDGTDSQVIAFEYPEDDVKEISDALLSKEQVLAKLKNGYTYEAIKQEADVALFLKNREKIVNHYAKTYNSLQKEKYIHGRIGVLPKGELDISSDLGNNPVADSFWADVLPKAQPAGKQ